MSGQSDDAPLCFGDIVSLYLTDGADYNGFMSTLG